MTPTDQDWLWASAFAKQALADLDTREVLAVASAPECHRLHFPQMGAEKLCKAFLCQSIGVAELTYTHCVVAKTLPVVLRGVLKRQDRRRGQLEAQMRTLRHLSRELEFLSPSCDAGTQRPENVEYPLAITGGVQTPVEFRFPAILEEQRALSLLIKLMRTAVEACLA